MVALLVPDAKARCRFIGGWPYCSDFCVASCWTGVKPDAVEVVIGVGLLQVGLYCENHGGNADTAEGTPFNPQVAYDLGDVVTGDDLIGKGKACVGEEEDDEFCISGQELYDTLYNAGAIPSPEDPDYICQNSNWSVIPEDATVLQALVYYQSYMDSDKDNDGVKDFSDGECQDCTRVEDEEGCRYECTTVNENICIGAGLRMPPPYIP